MQTPVILPELGVDAATEMVVSFWFAEEGEDVLEGDRLVEILAGQVTFDVPAPQSGRLVAVRVAEDDSVRCGDVLALLETEDEADIEI